MTRWQKFRFKFAWTVAFPLWWIADRVLTPLHDAICRWGERD